jgi:hypothetical protein
MCTNSIINFRGYRNGAIYFTNSLARLDDYFIITGNNIHNSRANGIYMYLHPGKSVITNNHISNFCYDIDDQFFGAGINLSPGSSLAKGGYSVMGNYIISNNNKTGINIEIPSPVVLTTISNNMIVNTGDNSDITDKNSGIRNRFWDQLVIKNNTIQDYVFGFYTRSYTPAGRDLSSVILEGNVFRDVVNAVRGGHQANNASVMPMINHRYINVTNKIANFGWKSLFDASIIDDKLTIYSSSIPTNTAFEIGDKAYNSNPTVGQPIGWVRIASGWVPMPNL